MTQPFRIAGPVTRPKDVASTALVLAVASAAWFLWGAASGVWRIAMFIGVALAVLAAVYAVMLLRKAPGVTTMATNPAARKKYWIAVAVEVVLIVAGFLILPALGVPEYVAAWTLAIVGLHFLPLAEPFFALKLRLIGLTCVGVALLAVILGATDVTNPVAVAGGLGGLAMLLGSGYMRLEAAKTSQIAY